MSLLRAARADYGTLRDSEGYPLSRRSRVRVLAAVAGKWKQTAHEWAALYHALALRHHLLEVAHAKALRKLERAERKLKGK